jgi:hypothetical protein
MNLSELQAFSLQPTVPTLIPGAPAAFAQSRATSRCPCSFLDLLGEAGH